MDHLGLVINLILFTGVFGIQSMLWFVYYRNYRFAILLTDMLPFYPYIIGLNILMTLLFMFIVDLFIIQILLVLVLTSSLYQFARFLTWFNDYKLSKYEGMLQEFINQPDIEFIRIQDYIENNSINKDKVNILMRHDVDINLKRTMAMIEVEKKLNIPSCYYFRTHAERFTFDQAQTIIDYIKDDPLFEVGFHYESISARGGDIEVAPDYFSSEIENFREIYPDLTLVSAHGDSFNNRRLIKDQLVDLNELNIVSSYDIGHDYYISEVGGNKSHPEGESYKRFTKRMGEIKNLPKGTLVQILVHADWWF